MEGGGAKREGCAADSVWRSLDLPPSFSFMGLAPANMN